MAGAMQMHTKAECTWLADAAQAALLMAKSIKRSFGHNSSQSASAIPKPRVAAIAICKWSRPPLVLTALLLLLLLFL